MMKRKTITKAALATSVAMLVLWIILGTTSTITWFKDEDKIVNALHFGDLDIEVSYLTPIGYKTIDGATEIFDTDALYEPGYTKVVYFKASNVGTVDFEYDLSVVPSDWVDGIDAGGRGIHLPDHLQFGVVFGDTEDAVKSAVATREAASALATIALSDYSADCGQLSAGESEYFAIIVCMPTDVANEANFRGDVAPSVDLGISLVANQIND